MGVMPAVILELLTTIYKASLNVFDAKDPDASIVAL